MAREGLSADPIVPPPQALRRYLAFSRLSAGALRAIARVVDRDDAFRERVVAAVDEDRVGRAGWLWLTRPEGWADELSAIDAEAVARAEEEQRARDERSAVKKLAAAQAAAAEAAAEADRRAREAEDLRAEVARQRALQADVAARLVEAEAQADRLAAARTEAVRNLKDVEARLVERSTELNAAKARIRELEDEARSRPPADGDRDGSGARRPSAPAREPAAGGGEPPDRPGEPAVPPVPPVSAADPRAEPHAGPAAEPGGSPHRDVLAQELSRAAEGAASLADSLASLARLLAGDADPATRRPSAAGVPGTGVPDAPVPGAPVPGGAPAPGVAPPAPAGPGAGGVPDPAGRGVGATGRVPVRLPGGIFDDSVAAAEHLLRTPGIVLVVDGYNVTMTGWPSLSAAHQRRRLVGVLAELAARTATETEIVFDGADVESVPVPAPVRSLVHVRFSPPGVEADDVVLDLVASLPAARPVVVASSDNRVRDGARALGANVVHARQLLDALPR